MTITAQRTRQVNGVSYLNQHVVRKKSFKGVCVSACLAYVGISPDQYQSTWTTRTGNSATHGILRRFGFAVRSRKSYIPKRATVGGIRKSIQKLNDPVGTVYFVSVTGHLLALDQNGNTVIDTASRKRDSRRVVDIKAVFKA